ncbi:E3 ubiquitin-protein ligase SHPRH [Chrysoperla carnea]|uniref:E3 ubiquitin-protein ligase SHPRH n=1 Tax=Chrysoperla carnea TaxID=189513 RepID=UPI001D05E043|nr:E3 ubiquitin-protein ligase SHPRH [Chrysoperla carnea]
MVREKKISPKKLDKKLENWSFVNSKAIINEKPKKLSLALEITHKQPNEENEKLYYLGNLCIGTISFDDVIQPKKWDRSKHIIVKINSDSIIVESYFPVDFFQDLISSPNLYFKIKIDGENVILELSLKLLDETEPVKLKYKKLLKRILILFFRDDCVFEFDEKNWKKKHDIDELYKAIRLYANIENKNYSYDVQHPNLKPTLRPYQAQAVQWMLNREHNALCIDGEIHPAYHKLNLPNNEILYVNAITMHITNTPPLIQSELTGGILADEMGLGKTVEVLACILCNPRKLDTKRDDDKMETDEILIDTQDKKKIPKNKNKVRNQQDNLNGFKKIRKSIEMDHDYVPKIKDNSNKVNKKRKIWRKRKVWKNKIFNKKTERKRIKTNIVSDDSENDESVPESRQSSDLEACETKNNDKRKKTSRMIVSSSEDEANEDDIPHSQQSSSEENDDVPLAQLIPPKQENDSPHSTENVTPSDDIPTKKKVKKEKLTTEKVAKKPASSIKQFCNLWYESKLAEVKVNALRERPTEVLAVQCLCGDFQCFGDEVICQDCGKKQHRLCVSYSGDPSKYCCPQCWEKRPLIKTAATLIITPSPLSKQWITEIKRHVTRNGLRVLVYKGLSTTGYLYPESIAEYDIVLTTYSVLQSEIRYVDIDSSRSMRFEKKYHVGTSPLLSLEWWRICLDEAQLVEGATSNVANMARKLNAVHKWAVSGTPAQRGIPDLYGLIIFLGIQPYNDFDIWKYALYNPYCKGIKEPLHKFLSKIMWRTCKKDILNQINIPKQTEIIHWLKFSAVEEFFYKREHEMCQDSFRDRLRNCNINDKLSQLDRHTLQKLLKPLLSIRQACTHPKVVRGKYLTTKNNVMNMEDLLEALINKNEQECSDVLRAQIAALNGLAGIHIIEHRYNEAGECYRDVLRLIDQHKNEVHVDTLPHLHTLYNLSEILSNPRVHLPPTLRDDQLLNEAKNLEEKYIHKHVVGVNESMTDYLNCIERVTQVENDFSQPVCGWFTELVDWMDSEDVSDDLLSRIESSLQDYSQQSELVTQLRSSRVLTLEIYRWWQKVDKSIRNLRDSFKSLKALSSTENATNLVSFSEDCVSDAVVCHLRPVKQTKGSNTKKKCFMCKIEMEMLNYECLIFLMNTKKINTKRKKSVDDDENKMEGTWKASEQEIILKSALSFGRNKRIADAIIREGELHLELCEVLKKEFRDMRRLWTYYGDLIASQDEISMCKERLRIRLGNEELPKSSTKLDRKHNILKLLDYNVENKLDHINVIEIGMIDAHFASIKRDKLIAEAEFAKKLGTLAYLKTLRKEQDTKKAPDPCPICTNPLQDNWSILQCGHSFCLECIHHLLSKYCSGTDLTCSVCRRQQPIADISYVKKEGDETSNLTKPGELIIKGSFSTKIEAITKCLLDLYKEDNQVKVLIFSTWSTVLDVVNDAFTKNHIKFLQLVTPNPIIFEKFKDKDEQITALLLPISQGAKGLNLIEATHVFLVEPLMNPSEELQAIGRVHRIGQTKPTFVHRFLIRETIEESLHNAVATNSSDWERKDVTLAKLSDLFDNCTSDNDISHSSVDTETDNVVLDPST